MIPTMIVFGLVFGWWWRSALVAAAIVWPAILAVTGVFDLSWQLPMLVLGASFFGVANAAVGALAPQAIRWLYLRRDRNALPPAQSG